MKAAAAIVLVLLPVAAGAANYDPEVRTIDGAILCFSPLKLTEAHSAAKAGDDDWLHELNCYRSEAGLKVFRANPYAGLAEPWRVRVYAPDGRSGTVWGYSSSFQTVSGKKIFP